MRPDTERVEQALRQYYGIKLRGAESIGISDVKQMVQGIGHNKMYSFDLEYVEKAKRHPRRLRGNGEIERYEQRHRLSEWAMVPWVS